MGIANDDTFLECAFKENFMKDFGLKQDISKLSSHHQADHYVITLLPLE
jgi:hypothetical protein